MHSNYSGLRKKVQLCRKTAIQLSTLTRDYALRNSYRNAFAEEAPVHGVLIQQVTLDVLIVTFKPAPSF